jgi:hypothetical protein
MLSVHKKMIMSNLKIVTHFACFKRSKSSDDVKTAVNILAENDDMIADGSRGYVLPTVTGKHQMLYSLHLADISLENLELGSSLYLMLCLYF